MDTGTIGSRTPIQKSVLRHKLKEVDHKWESREKVGKDMRGKITHIQHERNESRKKQIAEKMR